MIHLHTDLSRPLRGLAAAAAWVALAAGAPGTAHGRSQQSQADMINRYYEQQVRESLKNIARDYGGQNASQPAVPPVPFQVQRAGPDGPVTLSIPGSDPITFDLPNRSAPLIEEEKLAAQFPPYVGRLPRVQEEEEEVERTPDVSFRTSSATALYRDPATGDTATIALSDAGGMLEEVQPLMDEMMSQNINQQSETGFTRTQQFNGFQGTVAYDHQQRTGRITVLVNRVLIEITGRGLPVGDLEQAVEQLDMAKIAELQP